MNPYHNRTHAADVLQTMHVILHRGGLVPGYADPITLLACYLAAIIHDFEHLGYNNDFLINSSDALAVRYNDKAPMENHHLAAGVRIWLLLVEFGSFKSLCVCSMCAYVKDRMPHHSLQPSPFSQNLSTIFSRACPSLTTTECERCDAEGLPFLCLSYRYIKHLFVSFSILLILLPHSSLYSLLCSSFPLRVAANYRDGIGHRHEEPFLHHQPFQHCSPSRRELWGALFDPEPSHAQAIGLLRVCCVWM